MTLSDRNLLECVGRQGRITYTNLELSSSLRSVHEKKPLFSVNVPPFAKLTGYTQNTRNRNIKTVFSKRFFSQLHILNESRHFSTLLSERNDNFLTPNLVYFSWTYRPLPLGKFHHDFSNFQLEYSEIPQLPPDIPAHVEWKIKIMFFDQCIELKQGKPLHVWIIGSV